MIHSRFCAVVFAILSCCFNSLAQDCEEFQRHLQSIDTTFFPGRSQTNWDSIVNANRAFVDYTIEKLLDKPSDSCFISNRNLLRKLKDVHCDDQKTVIQDTLTKGEAIKVMLIAGKFDPNKHSIKINKESSFFESVDGAFPFGGQYGGIEVKIEQIRITIDGKPLQIPKKSYGNLYNPSLCGHTSFVRSIEVYESLSGDYIYLYIFGGNAASTYFAKLIFDKTQFLTKIVSDYYPMSIHGSFRADFIGY
ncbi:hypothetical protein POV27_14050 [Aureisphaera galaxeae]|uniref:hypothetical protein n=1 Tax=Aureisphaera galaxeae TaxID=1538023 RepID=UPI00234FF363|nr:hypothetical protein [Aureisphaera galaxeae]MDC8005180.1 hypothetical protein [Aureisphaera galaxeae]